MSNEQWIEFLRESIASHDRQIGEVVESQAKSDQQIVKIIAALEKLVNVTNEDATAIRTLARIADAHEQRIKDLEA